MQPVHEGLVVMDAEVIHELAGGLGGRPVVHRNPVRYLVVQHGKPSFARCHAHRSSGVSAVTRGRFPRPARWTSVLRGPRRGASTTVLPRQSPMPTQPGALYAVHPLLQPCRHPDGTSCCLALPLSCSSVVPCRPVPCLCPVAVSAEPSPRPVQPECRRSSGWLAPQMTT